MKEKSNKLSSKQWEEKLTNAKKQQELEIRNIKIKARHTAMQFFREKTDAAIDVFK